jgi:hypothetical protein
LKHAETLQGEVVQRSTYRRSGKEVVDTSARRVRRGASGCWLQVDPFPTNAKVPTVTLWGTNTRYTFELKRHRDSTDWALTKFVPQPEVIPDSWLDESDGANPPSLSTVATAFVTRLYTVNGVPLPELIASSDYAVTCPKNDDPGTVLVRFQAVEGRPRGGPKPKLGEATVRLAPAENWRVVAADGVQQLRNGQLKFAIKAAARVGPTGMPIPTEVRSTYGAQEAGRGDFNSQDTETYDLTEDPRVPETEFLLPAFGLPEPSDAPSRSRFGWYLAGAVALAAVAVVSYRLSRR